MGLSNNNTKDTKKQVALTFDDGPNTTITPLVLDKLAKYNITASFFLIGGNIAPESAKVAKRAFDMGCELASHSLTHSDMTKLTKEEIVKEMNETTQKILNITNVAPKFFRPPFFAINQDMFDAIDLTFIGGHPAGDWIPEVSSEQRAQGIIDGAQDGIVLALHDFEGNMKTVDALDIIIPKIQEMGYSFVTLSELFECKGIDLQPHSGIVYFNALDTKKFTELNL